MSDMSKEKANKIQPERGEIYLVDFNDPNDSPIGAEIRKQRPALILQNDIGNRFAQTTIIAAISSQIPRRTLPIHVVVWAQEGGLDRESLVNLSQLRTIDKRRLIRHLGKLENHTLHQVDLALATSIGLAQPA